MRPTMPPAMPAEKDRSGVPYGPPPAPGEELRLAIHEGELAGCRTFPVALGLSLPRLWQIPQSAPAGEVRVRLTGLRRQALELRPDVWTVLAGREIESVEHMIEAVEVNRDARAQLRRLAAAALRDIAGMSWERVADALEYGGADTRYCRRDAARGRRHWRAVNAWPYVVLPSGAPAKGWEHDAKVRLAWALWRRDTAQTIPPVAGWLDIGLSAST